MADQAPMSLEKARATPWPFRELKGQNIGDLLDSGQIGLRDLGFAFERAYNPQVRLAAQAILLDRLNNAPKESTEVSSHLRVYSSGLRSFSERRQIQTAMLLGLIPGLLLGAALMFLLISLINAITQGITPTSEPIGNNSWLGTLIAIVIIIAMSYIFNTLLMRFLDWAVFNRLDAILRRHRQGQRGEEVALNLFNRHFDGHWALFRNIEFPGQDWDIDYVLVGPDGMWIIEVKNFSGTYRNVGDRWEYRLKSYWLPMRKNPSRQARRNAARLSEFLKTRNVTQWANPVIFWVNPTNVPSLDTPSVPVWTPATLREEIKRLPSKPIPDEKREQIINILKEVCKPAEDDLYLFDDLE